jgi:hypothetical protein
VGVPFVSRWGNADGVVARRRGTVYSRVHRYRRQGLPTIYSGVRMDGARVMWMGIPQHLLKANVRILYLHA